MKAFAKINLALVVGPLRADGKHEVATVLQRVELADTLTLEAADELSVGGFDGDTIVASALTSLAAAAGVDPRWRAVIEKRIPVAAGLGGGSSDAAAALRLANGLLDRPLAEADLRGLAAALGADVPFFLADGPQLGTGDGSQLAPLGLEQGYSVVLLLPHGAVKESTGSVYARFAGEDGFAARRKRLEDALASGDLSALPPNDLASSPLAARLSELGAFRADVSGAGPTLYGCFADRGDAERAAAALSELGRTWVTRPEW
jgi:4-diphosphocytidyl-2-C-methyl-D-erythritol kinase